MRLSRHDLGINGVHTQLGNEITEAEFRGYMIAKMEEASQQRKEFKEEMSKHAVEDETRFGRIGNDISSLKLAREKTLGFIAGIGVLAGIIGSIVIAFLLKIFSL